MAKNTLHASLSSARLLPAHFPMRIPALLPRILRISAMRRGSAVLLTGHQALRAVFPGPSGP